MVDAVVSFAVQKLGDFLIQEAVFLRAVKDEVEWLKNELGWMQCFLKDAEEKQDGDNRIHHWISEIRNVAYDTEDVIDTFILKVKEGGAAKRESFALVKKGCCIFNKEINVYNIGKEIESLKRRVVDISRRREAYGIRNIGDVGEGASDGGAIAKLRQLRRTSSYTDEKTVVGFVDVIALLIDEILKEEPSRCVISILGMGGLGKTTLARKLYHHSEVERKFESRAWVCVSQEYRIRDLLQRIIRSLKHFSKEELEMLEKMTEEDLERHLREFLKDHRYMVVIDDLWHKEAWESLRRAFPDNSKGSRIIVTTRIKAVAERSDEMTYVHELRFLRFDESWELFCKKTFRSSGETSHCPASLQMLGRQMVEKCGGLPLAIIVLGGLLSTKQPHEWQTVKEHIWRDLRNDSIHISQLLTLSFNDLSYHLKPCFLYLGLFPEDIEINAEKLICLWVAEGFIPSGEETLEEAADDCLNELIGRSLVQVAKRNWRKITACRVHDLLRDLAVRKAKELNFLHIYDGVTNSVPSLSTALSYRRQAAHSRIERYVLHDYSNSSLRTLLFFNPDPEPSNIQRLEFVQTRFRLLRVLDLHSIRFDGSENERRLPEGVCKLIHLRYLGLRDTMINELPQSIVNLQALHTLDALSDTMVTLPKGICKLKQLRHLIGLFRGPLRVDPLTNLQTLKFVDIHDWIKINTMKLSNLGELHIKSNQGGEQMLFSSDPFANLQNLQSLSVELNSSMCFPSFQPLSHCKNLLQLRVRARIDSLPEQMHEYLPNLKYLQLRESQLQEDPMPILERLPNLMVLDLQYNNLRKLTCSANGFPRLEVLKLYWLHRLVELEVEDGAMPMLKGLAIDECSKFIVPKKLRSIPDAKVLNWDWANLFK